VRIAYIITSSDGIGGPQIQVRDLALALIARGHDPIIFIGGNGPAIPYLRGYGLEVRALRHLVRPIHPYRDTLAVGEMAVAIRRAKADLVATHTAKAGWLGRLACRLTKTPVIFTPHGWSIGDRISDRMGKVYCIAERLAAPFAECIINVCKFELELALACRVACSDRLVVVHNGVCDVPDNLRARCDIDPPLLVMVARMEPPKDHVILLRALSGLRHLQWKLQLIGNGPLSSDVRRLAINLGIDDRIRFEGACLNVSERLAQAQLFVLCSRFEAFPLSILEAMRAGLPVVASDVGGVREAVDQDTGLLVPKADVAALQNALATLISNRGLRAQMGLAGRRRYEQLFTFDLMFDKTLQLYQSALARCGRRYYPQHCVAGAKD
jgi:glycosyltransferase involved in cell wall biosynthesis